MTTRTGARVYRRAPRPLAANACAHCGSVVSVMESGRRRAHSSEGIMCTGSGVMVAPEDVILDPDAVTEAWDRALVAGNSRWENRDRSRPANPWSGKADEATS